MFPISNWQKQKEQNKEKMINLVVSVADMQTKKKKFQKQTQF